MYGESGCGKTSLLAKSASLVRYHLSVSMQIVCLACYFISNENETEKCPVHPVLKSYGSHNKVPHISCQKQEQFFLPICCPCLRLANMIYVDCCLQLSMVMYKNANACMVHFFHILTPSLHTHSLYFRYERCLTRLHQYY